MLLNKYVPQFLYNDPILNKIYLAQQAQLNILNDDIQDLINQCFIDTATWSLDIWEEEYGLKTIAGYNTDYRRTRVKARMRGQGTCTKALIENVAESFSNGEVDVIEDNANSQFIVKFIGVMGIPPNMDDLQAALEDIKPAHLAYAFEYTYINWNQFDNYNKTWDQWDALNLTWDQFEVYKE
ncbi:MAG: putative phage tail protein [Solirubrobacterales bacterium]